MGMDRKAEYLAMKRRDEGGMTFESPADFWFWTWVLEWPGGTAVLGGALFSTTIPHIP